MSSDLSGIPSEPGPGSAAAGMGGGRSNNVFLGLASIAEQSIEKRQDVEWKVSASFWAGIALFTWFVIREIGALPGYWCALLIGLDVLVFLVWTICWLMPMHSAGRTEGEWKHYYLDRALGLIRPEPAGRPSGATFPDRLRSCWLTSRSQPRFWGDVGLTAFFLLLSLLVIHGAQSSRTRMPGPQDEVLHLSGRNVDAVMQKLTR